jgi:hypothetical protein
MRHAVRWLDASICLGHGVDHRVIVGSKLFVAMPSVNGFGSLYVCLSIRHVLDMMFMSDVLGSVERVY